MGRNVWAMPPRPTARLLANTLSAVQRGAERTDLRHFVPFGRGQLDLVGPVGYDFAHELAEIAQFLPIARLAAWDA